MSYSHYSINLGKMSRNKGQIRGNDKIVMSSIRHAIDDIHVLLNWTTTWALGSLRRISVAAKKFDFIELLTTTTLDPPVEKLPSPAKCSMRSFLQGLRWWNNEPCCLAAPLMGRFELPSADEG